jgi:WD40 repeat protein
MNIKLTERANPFPGLRAFNSDEDYLFFGREEQSNTLVTELADNRFIAVVGTSGSGKSSLVRAGMLPALHGGFMSGAGSSWRVIIMRPGNDPIGNLSRTLTFPGVLDDSSPVDDGSAAKDLVRANLAETVLRRSGLGLAEVVAQARLPKGDNLLLVVDQFEELFRFDALGRRSDEDAVAFVSLLLEGARTDSAPIYVVLTMRSEFLGHCSRYPGLPEAINKGQYLVPRMTRAQRQQAIEGPIAVGGARATPRLVQRLLNDVGSSPDQLPILQHALRRTWQIWDEEGDAETPLDLDHYSTTGGMAAALSRHADEVYADLPDERSRAIAETVFRRLTDADLGVRRPTTFGELVSVCDADKLEVIAVIDRFRHPNVTFLAPPDFGSLTEETVIDISHESLMRVWQRLDGWVQLEARSARIIRRLADDAGLHARDEVALMRNPQLQLSLDWKSQFQPNAAWAERYAPDFDRAMAFLESSRATHIQEMREKEAEAKRRRAFLPLLVAAIALVVIVFITYLSGLSRDTEQNIANAEASAAIAAYAEATGTLAVTKNQLAIQLEDANFAGTLVANQVVDLEEAGSKLEDANLEIEELVQGVYDGQKAALASLALAFLDTNHKLSSLLGVESYLQDPGLVSLSSLLKILQARPMSAVFEADGVIEAPYLLERVLPVDAGSTLAIAFSPDGNSLASGGNEAVILLWDVDTGSVREHLFGHSFTVHDLDFSSDGNILISGGSDNKVIIWDLQKSEPIQFLSDAEGWVLSVAISPDGSLVAAGSADNRIYIWRKEEGLFQLKEVLDKHINDVNDIEFFEIEDTLLLASASDDNSVRLWDIGRADSDVSELVWTKWELGGAFDVEFSPDEKLIAASGFEEITAKEGPVVMIWDIMGNPRGEPLRGHDLPILGISFNRDGTQLVSSSADTSIRIWDLETRTQIGKLDSGGYWVFAVDFRPTGDPMLASASPDISLWTPPDQNIAEPLGEFLSRNSGAVCCVTFSPDSMIFATGGRDGVLRLWDSPSRSLLRELKGHTGAILGLDFSTSVTNMLIATGGEDGFVRLWSLFEETQVLMKEHTAAVNSVVFSPDGDQVVSGSADGTVRLWSVHDGNSKVLLDAEVCNKFGEELELGCGEIVSLAISRDGRFLAVVTGNIGPIILDLDTEQNFWLGSSDQTLLQTTVLAFNKDATTLVVGSKNGQITLWDIEDIRNNAEGQLLGILEPARGAVTSLTFNPIHNYLASSNEDGSIIFWDIDTREVIGDPFDLGSKTVVNVAFSPDGRYMVAGDSVKAVFIWDVSIDRLLALACSYAGRNLTQPEWNQNIFTGEDYRATCEEYPIVQLTPTPTPTPTSTPTPGSN